MRRKQVLRPLNAVSEVRASLHAHRVRVGHRLDGRPASSDAGMPSYQGYFDLMDRELATIESGLVQAEDAHVRNLVRIEQLRRTNEELTSDVYTKQTSARQILAGLYGSDRDFELAAISGRTPQDTSALGEQVDQTVKLLRNPEAAEPPRKVKGVAVEYDTLADDLEDGLSELKASRTDLERTKKAADGTRERTNAAIAEFDAVFPWVARNLEGLFRLAGEHELADRIRTSARRVTRRQGEESEETESAEASAEEAESGEAPEGEATEKASDAPAVSVEATETVQAEASA